MVSRAKTLVHHYRDYSISQSSTSGGWGSNGAAERKELFGAASDIDIQSASSRLQQTWNSPGCNMKTKDEQLGY